MTLARPYRVDLIVGARPNFVKIAPDRAGAAGEGNVSARG